jgi:hypothetical protein
VELEIVSRGIPEKEERQNHEESGCHHDEQRQGKDASACEIDGSFFPRRDLSLQRRRVQQGMASGICMCPHRDCCLSETNEQCGSTAVTITPDAATTPWKLAVNSPKINLAATFQKPGLVTIRFIQGVTNPALMRSARETACGPLSACLELAEC